MNAKKVQRVLWHARWVLLSGFIAYNLYCLLFSFKISLFLPTNGVIFGLYSLMGMLENYFDCKANCRT